MPNKGWHF